MEMIVVGAGDFIGAILRFWITKSSSGMVTFPLGTLLSNVLAALCIGIIVGLDQHYLFFSPRTRQFLTMGVFGGLSTFSTFSMETFFLFEQGKGLLASGNILLNVGLSLLFVFVGLTLVRATLGTG